MTGEAGGTYSAGVVRGGSGAPANPAGSSIRFPGTGTQALVATNPVNNPTVWSAETWFSTTTTSGGRLIGFGNSGDPNGTSSNYDRYVYMLDDGTLRYGIWTGAATTLTSPATYNDGTWHHVVATHGPGGMQLFVDGALVASGPAVAPQAYTGYWRLGADHTWGGATSDGFAGSLDEAAVYDKQLSAATVAQHYQLGKPATPNQSPTAAFTAGSTGLKASFDAGGSSDPDGTIASYNWQFGDGSTGTGATATHTYAAAGSYSVVLTVTDDKGAGGTATRTVAVTQPADVPPTASFTVTISKLAASFDASGSSDSDGTVAGYAWDFGDGTSGTGQKPAHTYALAGTYTVALTVTDDRGGSATTTKAVTTAANVKPSAAFSTSCTDLACSFNGSASADSDGTIASYAWSFGDTGTATGATATHTYAAKGSFDVTLTVTDDDGATDSVMQTVTVAPANVAPAASFTIACTNLACSLDGSGSSDGDGTVASYAWDFGDGHTATTAKPAHTYASAGTYTVALTVTDDKGATGTLSKVVTVAAANLPPAAAFTASCTGLTCSFDATASSDPDGSIVAYTWDFGDGTSGSGMTTSHTYAAGTYTAELTVKDDKGATAGASKQVSPAAAPNQKPTAAFTPTPSGLTVGVDGSASSDPDGSVVAWAWTFGDGTSAAGATANHAYGSGGSYAVTLTVTDDKGATDSLTKSVTVAATTNQPPTANFTAGCAGLACALDGSSSTDPDGSVAAYSWAFGDGSSGTGAKPSHTYAAAGSYSVVLTVTDDKGATGSITRLVSVTAATTTVAADAFGRILASGFGGADTGGAWTVSGTKVTSSVDTGSGRLVVPVGSTGIARLAGVANLGTDVTHTFWTETMPTGGGAYLRTIVRGTAAGDYYAQAKILATGAVQVSLSRSDAQIVPSVTLPGLTYTAGTRLAIRVQATGSAPTTLRAKVWPATATEPAAWTVTTTDSTAGYQVAGSVGVSTYVSGSATAALAVRYDDLVATGLP